MQSLLLEELNSPELARLRAFLGERCQPASLPGTYWLMLPAALQTSAQSAHSASCGPFCLAILLDDITASLKLELLVRPRMTLHCSCFAVVDKKQREFALAFWDSAIAAARGKKHDH